MHMWRMTLILGKLAVLEYVNHEQTQRFKREWNGFLVWRIFFCHFRPLFPKSIAMQPLCLIFKFNGPSKSSYIEEETCSSIKFMQKDLYGTKKFNSYTFWDCLGLWCLCFLDFVAKSDVYLGKLLPFSYIEEIH